MKASNSEKKEANTSEIQIERVDNLPLIITWLMKMHIHTIIDALWRPHGRWQGLSYGELALLFVAYVLHRRTHRLMSMEKWLNDHRVVIGQITGWRLGEKEATDDRLGILLSALGEAEEAGVELQQQLGRHLIRAYELPTEVGRYDTSSFNVYHAPAVAGEPERELLRWGHSKDKQAGLLQFKQGLGTLDPAGVPLLTHTLSGEVADDGLYLPAWWQMKQIVGHCHFLFIADCKAAAMETRAGIASQGGTYLFPLPMTGETPTWLAQQVTQQPTQEISLPEVQDKSGRPKVMGEGFVLTREQSYPLAHGLTYTWSEQWFVTRSHSLRKRQQATLTRRLERTETELRRLRPKEGETAAAFSQRVDKVLGKRGVADYFLVKVQESILIRKHYLKPGRPGVNTPYELESSSRLSLSLQRQEARIAQAMQLAGWRIHVSNAAPQHLSLTDSVRYYRDEWLVERGFHRFKKGSLPALPLYLHLPERIRGLMLLLLIALQALTLLEFVASRSLTGSGQSIAGLVPGNPKMKTERPSAERLLAAFDKLHLLITQSDRAVAATLVESLTPLQLFILELLHLSPSIFDLGSVFVPP